MALFLERVLVGSFRMFSGDLGIFGMLDGIGIPGSGGYPVRRRARRV